MWLTISIKSFMYASLNNTLGQVKTKFLTIYVIILGLDDIIPLFLFDPMGKYKKPKPYRVSAHFSEAMIAKMNYLPKGYMSNTKIFCTVCPKWEIKRPEGCSNTLTYKRKKRYFCTKKCKERFAKDPERFLSKK